MSKIAMFGLILAATIASTATSQARQIDVWGHQFNVDDGPTVTPPAPRFNALAPERRERDEERRPDLDIAR